jgi:hypothetical protein
MGLLSGQRVRPTRRIVEAVILSSCVVVKKKLATDVVKEFANGAEDKRWGPVTAKRDRRGRGRAWHQASSMMFRVAC